MIPLDDARAHVLSTASPLPPVPVPVATARGCVLAEDVVAAEDVPPFDNSAMDGFAVRAVDTVGASDADPVRLEVVDTVHAGRAGRIPVGAGQAVRIMTGAPMPTGADAVVMVERTRVVAPDGSGPDAAPTEVVEVLDEVPPGLHLRPAGDDVRAGARVFSTGEVLSSAHLGVLAMLGVEQVHVVPRPVVGVLSTGDELVAGGGPLAPGQIRDSNRVALLALVEAAGAVAVDLGCVRDEEGPLTDALRHGVAGCDVVLTSGGVSMGDVDLVKVVLDRIGTMRWMQVAIKPAKPLAVGTVLREDARERPVPVLGLPGNPVSSLVSFELFARPLLRRLAGFADDALDAPRRRAVADAPFTRKPDGKVHLARARCRWDPQAACYRAVPAGPQGSHQLTAMARADALAVLPDGDGVHEGDHVEVLLLG